MTLVILLVFGGVFTVTALLLVARSTAAFDQAKQTKAHLKTALAMQPADEAPVDIRKDETVSAVPILRRMLGKTGVTGQIRLCLYQANVKWTAGVLLLMTLGTFTVFAYIAYLGTETLILGGLVGLLGASLPPMWVVWSRKKRFDAFETSLPEALDLMVSSLRAGHSLVSALRMVAHEAPDPIGVEFRLCFEEQNYGLELRTAMENLVRRVPLQDLRIVVTAVLIQKESGGNLAEVLEKSAGLIRERFKLKREIRTRTAQGRLTGWILSLMPVVLGVLMYMVDPQMISVLWTRAIGRELLFGSIAMTIVGAVIIRNIVNMEV